MELQGDHDHEVIFKIISRSICLFSNEISIFQKHAKIQKIFQLCLCVISLVSHKFPKIADIWTVKWKMYVELLENIAHFLEIT